jgi:TRAP-type uncharacterized transport system substrate-binding protein
MVLDSSKAPETSPRQPANADGPRLTEPRTVRFVGDWGGANLTRVCGWLAQELWDRAPRGTRSWILSAQGCADNLRAVGSGEVDVAVMTPANFARMAVVGKGPFADEAYPQLRALGQLPHNDALLFAIRADLGVRTMNELRDSQPALRLALSPVDGGANPVGLAAETMLEASGIPMRALVEWGGELLYGERPLDCISALDQGRADAVIHEAIMTPWWHDLADDHELRFIPTEPEVLDALEREYSWARRTVPAGYLRGIDEPLDAIDFSGYLVVVREEMPDELAFLLTWVLGERSAALERHFRHLPADRSPLSYPIERAGLVSVPIPLHQAAERYYKQASR